MSWVFSNFMLTALHKNDIQTSIGSEVVLLNHTFLMNAFQKISNFTLGKNKHVIVYVNLYFNAFF